jgi:uncharacterized protein YjiS (DUF1127 family)
MTSRSVMTMPEAIVECRASESGRAKLPPAVDQAWTGLRSAWRRWLARRRLRRSIAHLDDRLLADIGLDPEHRGYVERSTRRRAASIQNFWSIEASTW